MTNVEHFNDFIKSLKLEKTEKLIVQTAIDLYIGKINSLKKQSKDDTYTIYENITELNIYSVFDKKQIKNTIINNCISKSIPGSITLASTHYCDTFLVIGEEINKIGVQENVKGYIILPADESIKYPWKHKSICIKIVKKNQQQAYLKKQVSFNEYCILEYSNKEEKYQYTLRRERDEKLPLIIVFDIPQS